MATEVHSGISIWDIDPTHSIAEFAVKHLVITTVKGRFRDLWGTLRVDEAQSENSSVEAKIAVASIDTNVKRRDNHLRSAAFFNAELFPHIAFRSRRIERHHERFKLIGDLTIRDVTKEMELEGRYEGQADVPSSNYRAAFTATTQVSRKEFDVRWNRVLEAGGAVIGDNVKITLHIEVMRRA